MRHVNPDSKTFSRTKILRKSLQEFQNNPTAILSAMEHTVGVARCTIREDKRHKEVSLPEPTRWGDNHPPDSQGRLSGFPRL